MINQIIYAVNLFTQLLTAVFMYHQIGTPKKSFLFTLTAWYIPFLGIHVLAFILPEENAVQIVLVMLKFLTLAIPFVLYEDSAKKRINMILLFYIVAISLEPVAVTCTCFIFERPFSEFYSQTNTEPMVNSGRILIIDFFLLAMIFIVMAYQKKKKQTLSNKQELLTMGIFILTHFAFLMTYYRIHRNNITETDNLIQIGFQALLFIMIFIQYFNVQRTRKLMEAEQELKILQSRMEHDYHYYMLADRKFNEISELRHDIQNQFQTIRVLLTQLDGQEQAEHMLDHIQEQLNSVRTVNYCANRTINAVLTVKLSEQRLHNIRTEIVLQDCENLPFNDYDLCSLVTNLFDNAVTACLQCSETEERFIELKSGIRNEFFLLHCVNSCPNQKQITDIIPKDGHGYGITILKNICQKYDGSYSLQYENHTAVATAALSVKKP